MKRPLTLLLPRDSILFIAMCLGFGGTALFSQEEQDNEVFELNPFEVTSGSGYVAQRTLAGTRLNSELSNVPQQISVFTPDFLDDIAATNIEDAMTYSLNVENLQEFTDPGNANLTRGINFDDFSTGRVRGLADFRRLVDFFETKVQSDNYNIDQITVSSGPNAVIFGLSGTGGTVSTSYKKAMLNDSRITLGTRVDSEDSLRFSLDVNQPVIKGKLAIRAVGLWEESATYRNSSDAEQERLFLTVTARPWKGANVRAYYEDFNIEKSLPRNVVAYDGGATAYLEHVANGGSPYYDNSKGNAIQPGWQTLVQKLNNNREFWILQAPGLSAPVNIGPASGGVLNFVQTINPQNLATDPSDRSVWRSLPLDSPLVSVAHNIHGMTTGRNQYGDIYGIIYNQQITPDFHIELGFNHEEHFTEFLNMASPPGAAVRVDPNMYLPDKVTPNPYKGMFYVDEWGQSTTDFNEMYGIRATASYNLDLTDTSKWLGRHQIMALYTKDRSDRFWSWIRTRTIPASKVDSYVYNAGSTVAAGQTQYRWYISPDTYEMVMPFDGWNGGAQPDGSYVYAGGNSPAAGFTWSNLITSKGATAAIQSFWLDERLVTLIGYRKGWFQQGNANPALLVNTPEVAWGYQNIRDVDRSLDTWNEETSEDAINYGVVLHLTKDDNKFGKWSIFYNFADIFNTPTTAHRPNDDMVPAAIGESYDAGIIWTGFDNRVGFRLNYYKTDSANVILFDWLDSFGRKMTGEVGMEKVIGAPGVPTSQPDSYANYIAAGRITNASGAVVTTPPVPFDPSTFNFQGEQSYWQMTTDRQSKGYEIEAWANPTESWSFRITAAKNEATDVSVLEGWESWLLQRYPYYKAWAQWEQGVFLDGNTVPLANATNSVTNNFLTMAPTYQTLKNSKGLRVNQSAGWRVNLTAKYTFLDGLFKGAFIGTHYRFRESPIIGYMTSPSESDFPDFPGMPAAFTAPDLDRPVYTPDRTDWDLFAGYRGKLFSGKIDYTVRLNVMNVLDDTDPVPMRSLSDGTTAVYAFKAPRTFILSVDLTY